MEKSRHSSEERVFLTPDQAPSKGAIPKSRSAGRLDAIRSSFRLGRKKSKRSKDSESTPTSPVDALSPDQGQPKQSRASTLARKISWGKYKKKHVLSPASTSPEASPSASHYTSEDDASSNSGDRQAPEGEDGARGHEPPSSGPPPLIADRGARQSRPEPAAPEHVASSPSPPFQSARTTVDDCAALLLPSMSHRALAGNSGRTPTSAAAAKSHILSITTPVVKKQQALEELRSALATVQEGTKEPKPKAEKEVVQEVCDTDQEVEEFGDLETAPKKEQAREESASGDMEIAQDKLSQNVPSGSDTSAQVNEKREHLYKILVIGELGTGKTSIIKRYVHQFFSQHYRATIGVDFALKVLNWDANTVIRLQLWDIAGQERFGNMTRVYYKEAVGAFIVFDVTRVATFDAVVKWKQDLDAKVQLPDGSPIPCVLLANKCDQQKEGMVNNAAKMEEYCKEKGFLSWFETSAKENVNIEEAARSLVTKILQNDKLIHSENEKDEEKFALDSKSQRDQKLGGKSCAC